MSTVIEREQNETANDNALVKAITARAWNTLKTAIPNINTEELVELNMLSDTDFSLQIGKKMAQATVFINTQFKEDILDREISKTLFLQQMAKHGGGYSSAELAKQLDITTAAIAKRRKEGQLFHLKVAGKKYHPSFQFDDNYVVPEELKKLINILKNKDEMAAFAFLIKPHTDRDGIKKTVYELLKGPKQPRYIYQQIMEKAQKIDVM